jgi:hypothetical protein
MASSSDCDAREVEQALLDMGNVQCQPRCQRLAPCRVVST